MSSSVATTAVNQSEWLVGYNPQVPRRIAVKLDINIDHASVVPFPRSPPFFYDLQSVSLLNSFIVSTFFKLLLVLGVNIKSSRCQGVRGAFLA